jgi:hypothetical protein
MKRKPKEPCHLMNQDLKSLPRLADIEREVVAEAREWGRQRLEERLQQLASQSGEIFPPQATQAARAELAKRIGGNKAGR